MSSARTSAVAHNISGFAMLHSVKLSGQSVLLTLLRQQITLSSVSKYLIEATLDMHVLDQNIHVDCPAEAGLLTFAVCLQETLPCSTTSTVATNRS